MKSFQSIFGICVLVAACAASSIFGADNDDKRDISSGLVFKEMLNHEDGIQAECIDLSLEDEAILKEMLGSGDEGEPMDISPEKEGMLESLTGPGSFARGVGGYSARLCRRALTCRLASEEFRACCALLWIPVKHAFDLYPNIVSRLSSGVLSDDAVEAVLPYVGYFAIAESLAFGVLGITTLYENVGVMRNIQRAQAHKPVEDEDVKIYINQLLDLCNRHGRPPRRELQKSFFENYRSSLSQLQTCAEQVLLERGLCRQRAGGNVGVELVEPLTVALGPDGIVGGMPTRLKFHMLRGILQNGEEGEEQEEVMVYSDSIQERLNYLLGYLPPERVKNIKSAKNGGEEES